MFPEKMHASIKSVVQLYRAVYVFVSTFFFHELCQRTSHHPISHSCLDLKQRMLVIMDEE